MRIDDQRDGVAQEPDWLQQQLRVQLLPRNPHFQRQLLDVRQVLEIPEEGLPDDGTGDNWLEDHLAENDPASLMLISLVGPIPGRELASRVARRVQYDGPFTILDHTVALIDAYQLPQTVFGHLMWLIITGEPIPEQTVTTTYAEVVVPPDISPDASPEYAMVQTAIYDRFRHGLPDIPGDLVVIKMMVNEYTTKRELEDSWAFIEDVRSQHIQGKKPANRRRAGGSVQPQIDRWLAWQQARSEGSTLKSIADEAGVAEETIRNALRELDRLMLPNNRGA